MRWDATFFDLSLDQEVKGHHSGRGNMFKVRSDLFADLGFPTGLSQPSLTTSVKQALHSFILTQSLPEICRRLIIRPLWAVATNLLLLQMIHEEVVTSG